jgi:hypothetical protein
MRNTYKILVGISRSRWEDNIRMDLGKSRVGNCGLDSPGSG